MSESQKFDGLNDVDRLQAQDVLSYLKHLREHHIRGQTIKEILYNFSGIISERAVLKQVERLKSWDMIRQIKIKVRGKEVILLYEASEI